MGTFYDSDNDRNDKCAMPVLNISTKFCGNLIVYVRTTVRSSIVLYNVKFCNISISL